MVDLEGPLTNINIYNLATIGTVNMISEAGTSLAVYSDNVNVFPDVIALFQLASGSGGAYTSATPTAVPTTLVTSAIGNPTPTGGWQFRGCYTDIVGQRTLLNSEATPGGAPAMTVESCQVVCQGLGYTLAGLEYAQECCESCSYNFNIITTLASPDPNTNSTV